MQEELEKERKQGKAELATRDVRINGLFEELTATQSEMQDIQQELEQVFIACPDHADEIGNMMLGHKIALNMEGQYESRKNL